MEKRREAEAGMGHVARGRRTRTDGVQWGEKGRGDAGVRAEDLGVAGGRVEARTEGMMGRGCVRGRARGGVREPPPRQARKLSVGVGEEDRGVMPVGMSGGVWRGGGEAGVRGQG